MNESRPDVDRLIATAPAVAQWGSDHIADVMRALDFEYVALTPGASFRGLHDSLVNYLGNTRPGMLLALHEESAVALAHGYAGHRQAAGRGAAQQRGAAAVDGDLNAWCERVPMLIYGGNGLMDAAARVLGRLDAYPDQARSCATTSSGQPAGAARGDGGSDAARRHDGADAALRADLRDLDSTLQEEQASTSRRPPRMSRATRRRLPAGPLRTARSARPWSQAKRPLTLPDGGAAPSKRGTTASRWRKRSMRA
jgi:hypothetical protein